MRNHITQFAVLLVGFLMTWPSAVAKTIHVSPAGNDAWTGRPSQPNAARTDGPVATLTRARDIIRQWKSAGPLDEPVRVIVADGLYSITGITMENNLVYNTKTGSFHQHYGKENVVRNNILVCSENPQIAATRVEDHLSFTLEHNIVYWKTGALFGGPWTRIRAKVDKNCYFNATGDPVTFAGMELEAWQKLGYDQHSVIADPLFVDVENNDYRLKPNSPALKIGFEPFDYGEVGLYGDAAWVERAAQAKMPK